jgi:hypothetical protein
MMGPLRDTTNLPIVPAQDGKGPAWIVVCLDCPFAHDAHALSGEDAVQAIAPTHERTHRLIARAVDYTDHPLYRR